MKTDRYSFGFAKDLYDADVHPRIALGPADLIDIRKAVRRGNGRKVMTALREKVRVLVDLVLSSDNLHELLKGDSTHYSPGARICSAIDDISMVGALDEDARAIDAATQVLDTIILHTKDKHHIGHGRLAMAYDLLHSYLTPRCRRDCVRTMRQHNGCVSGQDGRAPFS